MPARIAGHFHVDGVGTDRATLALTGGGRLDARRPVPRHAVGRRRVDRDRSRHAAGVLQRPAIEHRPGGALCRSRFEASLTGTGSVKATVRDLLIAEHTTLDDYDI